MLQFTVNCLLFLTLAVVSGLGSSETKPGLLLTPLIKAGLIKEARAKARVVLPNAPPVESYSGYLTVNEETGSNLFFWFFPSKNVSAPVGLWLQGGPGAASTYALFNENGPYVVQSDLSLTLRKYPWTDFFAYLYIDQPAGTGFSYTEKDSGYVKNQVEVGRDLYRALLQFYVLFPEWRSNDFYVTGESYAGKYVPAIGYKLHQERESSGINFKGVAIGNGLVSGATMFRYSDILYYTGLFDYRQRERGLTLEKEIRRAADEKRWMDCFYLSDHLLAGDRAPSYFTNVTGITNYFNSLLTVNPVDTTYSDKYLDLPEVKEAIHVGNRTVDPGEKVYNHLLEDFCQSVSPWLETLADNGYQVLLYSGALDIVVGATCTETLLQTLRWKGAQGFEQAERKIWRLNGESVEVQGFITSYENFHYVVVRNAGHMVPHDQPLAAYEMISKFIQRQL